jgi:hypothetical protein
MGGACSKHGRSEEYIKKLVGKPEGNRSLRRSRRRWENVRKDLREIAVGEEGLHLAKDRGQWEALVNTVTKLRVP